MQSNFIARWVSTGVLTIGLAVTGCATNTQTGAAAGGAGGAVAGGAAAGAAAGSVATPAGAAVGAGIGAIGGAIIGSAKDRNDEQRARANHASESSPALASAVIVGANADLNDDGFVTTDEIIAMQKAGLSDGEIIARCEATQQIFQLSAEQERKLLDNGVSKNVVTGLRGLNKDLADPASMKGSARHE